MNDKPMSVAQVAAWLEVSERFVKDELRRNNLRGSKLSGRAGWRIEKADLDAYVAARANVRPVRKAAS